MKRLWQIWFAYVICLAAGISAISWLTLKALELDKAEAQARAQIELEKDVNSALWKLDAEFLTPLIAQEAARPYLVYDPFYSVPGGKGSESPIRQVASPPIKQPSPYVLLHFQLEPDGQVNSPQAPPESQLAWAIDNGTTAENIETSNGRLVELRSSVQYKDLVPNLPETTIPGLTIPNIDVQIAQTDEDMAQQQAEPDFNYVQQSNLGRKQIEDIQIAKSPPKSRGPKAGLLQEHSPARSSLQMRGDQEWLNRNTAFQRYTQEQIVQQRLNLAGPIASPLKMVSEGVSRPIWVGSSLLLARRVTIDDRVVVQGAWFDWPRLKSDLLEKIADFMPNADLVPLAADDVPDPGHSLATLPVQLLTPTPDANPAPLSPIRISLMIAWGCLLSASGAVALLLLGVVSLSERRARFVSSVSHELRTPLTTFRMYSEMLAEGMVRDERQRQSYLETLRSEADRLYHLVENVLAYAQLERGRRPGRRERTTLGDLIDGMMPRLSESARQAEMELTFESDESTRDAVIHTDPAAAEQVLFNLVDNACKYASTATDRRIHVQLRKTGHGGAICVKDHGPGISPRASKRLFRPFSKSVHDAADTAPGIGLGLALSRRLAQDLGGTLSINKANGDGAIFVFSLPAEG